MVVVVTVMYKGCTVYYLGVDYYHYHYDHYYLLADLMCIVALPDWERLEL